MKIMLGKCVIRWSWLARTLWNVAVADAARREKPQKAPIGSHYTGLAKDIKFFGRMGISTNLHITQKLHSKERYHGLCSRTIIVRYTISCIYNYNPQSS